MCGDESEAGNQNVAPGGPPGYDAGGMTDDTRAGELNPQFVVGCIGTSELLFDKLSEVIQQKGLSWTRVAKRLELSRQGLICAIKSERVPYYQIERVCSVIGVDPFDFFDTVAPERNRDMI